MSKNNLKKVSLKFGSLKNISYVSTVRLRDMKDMMLKEKEEIAKELFGDLVDTCESCEEKLGVWTENPFDADVRNVSNMEFLCKECWNDLILEVYWKRILFGVISVRPGLILVRITLGELACVVKVI